MQNDHDQEQNLTNKKRKVRPASGLSGAAVYREMTNTGKLIVRYLPLLTGEDTETGLRRNLCWTLSLLRQVARLMAKRRYKNPNPTSIQRTVGRLLPDDKRDLKNPPRRKCSLFTDPGPESTVEKCVGMMTE